MENNIVIFQDKDIKLEVPISLEKDTVWLTANQMAELFDKDEKTIRKHINNIFEDEELDYENNTQKMRVVGVKQKVCFYNLDIIISVGYRVKSQKGINFRRWATNVIKERILHSNCFHKCSMFKQIAEHEQRLNEHTEKIDFFIRHSLPPTEGISVPPIHRYCLMI
jgi:hypothetical protein